MDAKTLLLGIMPPVLALLAEQMNPVSAAAIEPHARRHAIQHVPIPAAATDSTAPDPQQLEALTTTITGVAETAAEVAGIVPTWISFTAAVSAVLLELVDVKTCLLILLAFTLISSVLGIPFFQRFNFRDEALVAGMRTRWTPFCGRTRRVDCISRYIKGANILLALLVFGVWLWGRWK